MQQPGMNIWIHINAQANSVQAPPPVAALDDTETDDDAAEVDEAVLDTADDEAALLLLFEVELDEPLVDVDDGKPELLEAIC
jgi:hypothetical protein